LTKAQINTQRRLKTHKFNGLFCLRRRYSLCRATARQRRLLCRRKNGLNLYRIFNPRSVSTALRKAALFSVLRQLQERLKTCMIVEVF